MDNNVNSSKTNSKDTSNESSTGTTTYQWYQILVMVTIKIVLIQKVVLIAKSASTHQTDKRKSLRDRRLFSKTKTFSICY